MSRSIIFDQSENRLHTEKGLLVYFVYPRLQHPTEATKAFHQAEIIAYLDKITRLRDGWSKNMTNPLTTLPAVDGYRMPAEFEPHSKTWMLWPERLDNWREHALPAQRAFADVARAIAQFEPVTMGVNPGQYENARKLLPPQVQVVVIENNDAWMRDCGPTFVIDNNGAVRGIDWIFNAWGGLDRDCTIPGTWMMPSRKRSRDGRL